jgi:hypothetical protein
MTSFTIAAAVQHAITGRNKRYWFDIGEINWLRNSHWISLKRAQNITFFFT